MGEAMISGAGGGIGGKIYKWKRYELNSKTVYTWDKWSLNSTTIYTWNKWDITKSLSNLGTKTIGSCSTYIEYRYGPDIMISGDGVKLTTISGTSSGKSLMQGYYYLTNELSMVTREHIYVGKYGLKCIYRDGYNNTSEQSAWVFWVYEPVESKGSISYGHVTSTLSSAYPSNGASGSYWYESAGSETTYSRGDISYGQVQSESSSTYPNGGAQSGYWYENRTSRLEYSMGAYKDSVYSTARNQYPDNGHDASYWYVFDGES